MSMFTLVVFAAIIPFLVTAGVALIAYVRMRRNAKAAGYPGVLAHLRAVPRNDAEKRAAVDLALKGAVICVLGLFLAPLILIGLVPFYYGSRKLILVWLGLDLLDDGDLRSA